MIGDPNVIIGCLPSEVLAPSPGTKSLDGNFSVGDGTSKFWWKMYFTRKDTVHTCILKKKQWSFFLILDISYCLPEPGSPPKIYSRHAQLGSGQRLRAARRNRKLKGSKSWICPSLFQPSRGGQWAVLVVLLMSRLTVGTKRKWWMYGMYANYIQ